MVPDCVLFGCTNRINMIFCSDTYNFVPCCQCHCILLSKKVSIPFDHMTCLEHTIDNQTVNFVWFWHDDSESDDDNFDDYFKARLNLRKVYDEEVNCSLYQ